VIPSPSAEAIPDGVVLVEGDKVVAVGPRTAVQVPQGAQRIDCSGGTVVAGFWNSHVHFIGPGWNDAATAATAALEQPLIEMLTRWGFVHVVDTGSGLANTLALAARIDAGEVAGPTIISAGPPFIAVGGQPRYVPVPLPELTSVEQARTAVESALAAGARVIKLMTVSLVQAPPAPVMPLEIVRAVTQVAHAHGVPVLAHPTNAEGFWVALEGGVDVLAHTVPQMGPWSEATAARLVAAGIAVTPTLDLFHQELAKNGETAEAIAQADAVTVGQLRTFRAAGGTALFGTDVGYTSAFDPTREYALLQRAGFDARAILAMLTSAPAARFAQGGNAGALRVGADADVVVLEGNPLDDAAAWTRVRHVARAGKTVYEHAP
jgi:imidazolonepropionase-like amidohydrolase